MSPQFQLFAVGSSLQNLFGSSFLRAHVARRRRRLRVTSEIHHAVQVAGHLAQVREPRVPEIIV
jgi:hypothetical protein